MDNVNTEELSENTMENGWVLVNKTQQVKDIETSVPETQKDLANQIDQNAQISNNGIEVIHEYVDSDNTSNDVSVITESDTDNPYQNFFSTYQDNKVYVSGSRDMVNRINHHDKYRSEHMVDKILEKYQFNQIRSQYDAKVQVLNIIIFILFGCITGIIFGIFLANDDRNLYRDRIKDLHTEYHTIINTFKEINATFNEIKAHILTENKLNKDHAWELLKDVNYSNIKKNNKYTKESPNNDPDILDNLQVSLNVLSLLNNAIYDNDNMLKNKMNETLNIVNNTKVLYETLISFNNSTQNTDVSATVRFLQNAVDKIHHTSYSLLTDLVKRISNIMLNVHGKYSKVRDKFNEKLCYLKNVLPDDNEFLKQLMRTMEENQVLSNYKHCHSKNISINGKTDRKQNTRINDTKKQTKKTDDSMLHTKFEKRNIEIDNEVYNNQIINDHSQPTKTGQNVDETLNNSFDETSEQNTETMSDYAEIDADKTKVNGPKPNIHFKSNNSIKRVSNPDKPVKQKISPQIKVRNYVSRSDKGRYKSSFRNEPTEQDHRQMKSADWLFERADEREKLRQASSMHFPKVLKTFMAKDEIDASVHDLMRRFGQSIEKIMHIFEQKIEQHLKKHNLLKE